MCCAWMSTISHGAGPRLDLEQVLEGDQRSALRVSGPVDLPDS